MLDLRAPALSEVQRMVKRAFDLVVCFFSLPFSLPLIAGIALAVKLDSPGPIFYRAHRIGENGRVFGMLKFRTMVCNADQLPQPGHVPRRRRQPHPQEPGRPARHPLSAASCAAPAWTSCPSCSMCCAAR